MNPGSQRGVRVVVGALGLAFLVVLALALVLLQLSPVVILAVVIAGIAVPLFILSPEPGLHLLIALVFVENLGDPDRTITVGKLGGLVIMGSWLLSVAVSRRLNLRLNAMTLSLILFVAWSALSITQAYDNQVAVRQTATFVQMLLLTLMVGSVAKTTEAVRRVLRTIVGMTVLVAAHGLAQYALWGAPNTAGILLNRNLTATYLTFAIACAYLLYQMSDRSAERMALLFALPLMFLALALTFSRTGVIGLAVVCGLVGYHMARSNRYLVLGMTAGMILVIAVGLPGAFYKRVESIGSAVRHREDTFGQRMELAEAGVHMITAHPVLGVGVGNYPLLVQRYGRTGFLRSGQWSSHNTFVGVAAESGIPALLFLLAVFAFALRDLRRVMRYGYEVSPMAVHLAVAVELSIVALIVSGLSGNYEKTKLLYVFLGLILSLDAIRRSATQSAPAPGVSATVPEFPSPAPVAR